ncbi:MAG: hypothetical protein ABSE28_22345 [Candidatus Sulfotelmatobacter sp.]
MNPSKFLSQVVSFVAVVLFTLALPFLVVAAAIWGGNLTGAASDSIWPIKMGATVLGPFSAVLWYILVSHLVLRRRAGYLMQLVIFVGTAAVIYLLLINGVYHL